MVGKTISHFRIVVRIGEGGMGVVYRAEDENLRRPVALKVLPPDLVGDEERRLRFLREARAAAAVTHPNIATVYEVGQVQDESGQGPGIVFIAMELIEGRTLRSVIGGRPVPIKEALGLARQVAEGVARAHASGVIHRDLKPDNIMVTPEGHAKILDFGLAKLLESPVAGREAGAGAEMSRLQTISGDRTREGRVLGTVAYMSPEQARGRPVDGRSDIFAFGIVLYEMLTGRPPFEGATGIDTMSAILQKDPVPAGRIVTGLPAKLDDLLAKCLEKDPADRYQHADELAVDLRQLLRLSESGAQPIAAAEPAAGASIGRNRLALMAGLAGMVVAMLGILYAFDLGGLRTRLAGKGTTGPIESIAVLPLTNMSRDPDQEFFSDGMTEALIADLAKIKALRVISRTSAMRYKGTDKPLQQIARELGVDAIVEGSVMRSGERVRITAQLIEAATDRHIWAESYERDLRDVLGLQGEVARAIAQEVKVALAPGDAERLTISRLVVPAAHEACLKGRYYLNQRTRGGYEKAIEHFGTAIQIDPGYAAAYAGLAQSQYLTSAWGHISAREGYPLAKAHALKALEIDPECVEALATLGIVAEEYDFDKAAAERSFKRAIELNPGYSIAHYWYAFTLASTGRFEDSLREAERAKELDPFSLPILAQQGRFYLYARRYDEAIERQKQALTIDPEFHVTHWVLGRIYEQKEMYREAIVELRRGWEASQEDQYAADLAHAYALSGDRQAALRLLEELESARSHGFVASQYLGVIYLGLGDPERALDQLEKAWDERSFPPDVGVDPRFDRLRGNARFQRLLQRAGLAR